MFNSFCSTQPPKINLNTPLGLFGKDYTNKITLYFYGYNSEPTFSGYDIYITSSCFADLKTFYNNTAAIHYSDKGVINTTIEANYILSSVSSATKVFPSISPTSFTIINGPGISVGVTELSFDVTYDAANLPIDTTAKTYCIAVTAVDILDKVESMMSNAIQCHNGTCGEL